MEAGICKPQIELYPVGIMLQNMRGTQIPNPLIAVIDVLKRHQFAAIRSMFVIPIAYAPCHRKSL